ncbi:MAG TPA: class I SAM-dependent methyltransferase [Nitrosopumilaceae archaeon]|nr:class I SAM-dependent methyltransferase [Nitrosopumilaceae archaeon]
MSPHFDPIQYKLNSKANWNTVAFDYHNNWADKHQGPFKSTREIVNIANINQHDKVLDLACGTGAVSKEIIQYIDEDGFLIGIDLSRTALSIAKKSIQNPNVEFLEMDVEHLTFNTLFDKVLCQYGLMFFPNVGKVLKSVKKILKQDGRLAIAVHGISEDVPYFSCIMNPVLKFIPDIRPEGTPTVHRFGNPDNLNSELTKAGFSNISIKKFNFCYEVDTFEEYWQDYLHSTANYIRPKIESHGNKIVLQIKTEAKKNVSKYETDGRIIFPWSVLIASASK